LLLLSCSRHARSRPLRSRPTRRSSDLLNGLDALLSILQMPAGVGVATVGVGAKGAENAARFAAASLAASGRVVILANTDADLQEIGRAHVRTPLPDQPRIPPPAPHTNT